MSRIPEPAEKYRCDQCGAPMTERMRRLHVQAEGSVLWADDSDGADFCGEACLARYADVRAGELLA